MFDFSDLPFPVREDLKAAYRNIWSHFSEPGATYDATQRSGILHHARRRSGHAHPDQKAVPASIAELARTLYADPGSVDEALVRRAADDQGDPATVEAVSLVSMLAAVDGAHRALGLDLTQLPDPLRGEATGIVSEGLTRRRTHLPMPRGAIPSALDLVPQEARVFQGSFGAQYMTDAEMAYDDFERSPGLNRAQMELISSRTSLLNECFY
ncbi:MAG: hypothetical protein M3132_04330 [Actinomycetia bacterium]|nr:hypothetical protein [Actinomycetes bacterium]